LESAKWHKLHSSKSSQFIPVNAKFHQIKNISTVNEVVFSTFETNKNSTVIFLKPNVPLQYTVIKNIFQNTQLENDGKISTNTWLVVQPLAPVTSTHNLFSQLSDYAFKVALWNLESGETYVVHFDDILAHCAWLI
jgi:hypothetical protein